MFVHFPIAFFWGALAMEGAAIVIHERFHTVSAWLLYLGAVSAVVTMLTGIHAMNQIAEAEGGHAEVLAAIEFEQAESMLRELDGPRRE